MADQVRTGVQVRSTRQQLAEDAEVSIDSNADAEALSGSSPRHAPRRAAQSCVDLATGIKHQWWNGAWHL